MVQVPEMGDAQAADLEHEDRVAVSHGPAVPGADVGRHVADADVEQAEIVDGGPALAPTTQDVGDTWIGAGSVMRIVRPVHRSDVRHHGRADIVIVIGGASHAARALYQESR